MRLEKFLADQFCITRSQVKDYCKKNIVLLNQEKIKSFGISINPNLDQITVNGQELTYKKFGYYMYHKPAGEVSANKDAHYKTVMDQFTFGKKDQYFPVGRLDVDTEGLILITNDGDFSHMLMSPKKNATKKYYFEAEGMLDSEKIERLETGIFLENEEIMTKPAKVEVLDQDEATVKATIEIVEGKFHQVKRMLSSVQCKITYLKRVQIKSLSLDENLAKGSYRELTKEELEKLYE